MPPVDKKQVLADYDAQVAAIERVCVVMKQGRLAIEAAMSLSDEGFTNAVTEVGMSVAAEMDRAERPL